MKDMAEQIYNTLKEKRSPSMNSQQQHHYFQYDDTEDSVMQEIEEQATRKKMEEEALQARLKKMDAVERQNEKKKKRKEKKIQKKQQKCETQKKAAERKMEELDEAADNGMSTIPQRKNEVSNLEADKETNTKVIHASRPTAINKESKSGMQHFTPNYDPSGIKTESRSSILEKQFNIGEKSSVMFLDNPPKEDPIAASLLQHHLQKYEELMKVQPARHTEQQLKVEREQLRLEQIHKDQDELENLREKQDNNMKAFGCRSPGGSVILPEFPDEKQLEKLRQEHLQKQRHLELIRNQEEAYEIQQSRLQQLRQQKIKQEAPKCYPRDKENARNCHQNPTTHTPGKTDSRWKLENIVPKSQEDEEEMLKQALEISKMTAKEKQERLYKRVDKKGESNTTMKAIRPRSTLIPPIKLQDLGGLQSIWDIEVSKPSPSYGSTSVSHNPDSQLSPKTYAEAIKPKSTGPSWTIPLCPPSSSFLNSLPSPTYAELVKLKPCLSFTVHSEQGIISRQQSVDQYQNEIHPITNSENQQGHVALNCNNSASFFVESTSKMGSWTRKPWDHQLDFGTKYSHTPVVSVMPPSNLRKGEKQPHVPLKPPYFVLGNQQHNGHQGLAPLVPPSSFSNQQQGCHQRPISSRLPNAFHTRQKQEEGTQIYSDEKVSQASVRVEAWNPSLDKIQENESCIHTVSMSTGSSTKFSPSFCGKQPEYSIRQQDPIPQKTQKAVEPPSKVERQEIIGLSFCKANAIVFPTVQNVQHNMEVDVQSAKVDDDRKMIVEDWDAEVDEVIAKRKPFIEDLGKGKKRLWSCNSIIQEKMVFPCRKDFASVIHEFKVRKENQDPKLCGGGPDNAEHKSELCQKEDLLKGSSMSGYCGSASASRRVNTVGKGGFKQKQSNRNHSELNKSQSRMHKNKECDTVTWSSTKSEFKRFPEETYLPARETNDLDRNNLKKNFSDCDTTNLSPHAHSTCSCQEPRTIPPSIQQNNVPTKQAPLKQLGKPVPYFPQTENWDDEIDSVPYIQVDVTPKEVIPNGEYLNQDMLVNQLSCILNMEETASKTINNKTTAKTLDAQKMHDSFAPHNGSSSENKRPDTEIGHADVMSRFQFEMENKNCSLLESNQFLPQNNFAADEKGDRLSPARLPHFSKFLNVTSAMSLGPTFTKTEPKTTGPDFIQMNSIVTEQSKDHTSESKTLNGQTDSIMILEETEATNDSEANFLNPLPSGLPPDLVQAYLQNVALTGFNSVKMAPVCLMPGMWPNLGMTSPVFYSLQQRLQHQRQQQAQQHEGSVNEKSNESLSQLKTEIGNIAANQQYNIKLHDVRDCPLMLSDKVSQIEEVNNQSSAAIYFDGSQSEAKMQVDRNQYGKAMHVDNNKSTNLTPTQSRNQIKSNSGCLENGGHLIQMDSYRNNNDSQAKPKTNGPIPFHHPRLTCRTRMCDIKNSSSENSSNTCSENDSHDSDRKNSLHPRLHHMREN